jgi:hypothetical protein
MLGTLYLRIGSAPASELEALSEHIHGGLRLSCEPSLLHMVEALGCGAGIEQRAPGAEDAGAVLEEVALDVVGELSVSVLDILDDSP